MSHEQVYQVNLEELIEKYIWGRFRQDTGFPRKFFLRRKNFYIDVRWGYVDFAHVTQSEVRPKTPGVGSNDRQLYCSEYENKTDCAQKYTFETSRETTASTKFELQENYTIGASTSLEVNFGEVVKVGGELSGSYSVTETNGQEFSKTLAWNINTEINVPKHTKAIASLYVFEEPQIIDFTVTTTMSLAPPSRCLPVTIRKQENGEEVKTYWIKNIECLFNEKYTSGDQPKVRVERRRIGETDQAEVVAILTTRGVCRSVTWQNQHVEVDCEKLTGAPSTPEHDAPKDDSQKDDDKDAE